MTKLDVLKITEPIEAMYMDCTSQLIINLSRHFASGKGLATAEWKAAKLSELSALTQESIEIIAANTGQAPDAIKKAITEGMGLSIADTEKTLQAAAKAGKVQGVTGSWQASDRVMGVIDNLSKQAVDDFNVVNTVMLNSTVERYVNAINYCVSEEKALIEKLQSASNLDELQKQLDVTQKALNDATFNVAIGAEARTTALRRTVKQLADQGITGYVDKAGHNWTPEAYVNMDIRTTVHNAAIMGQRERAADYNVSTFQVSSHAGARPLCEPYQGKIYSWDGTSGVVHDLNGKEYEYESVYSTSYGEAAGLFGINCGHSPQTFVDGFSIPRYEETQDKAENDRQYELSQKQRYYEREIRHDKTEALSYEAAGEKEAFAAKSREIKAKNAEYKQFCSENGLTPRIDRTQVIGYNRSVAGKANAAAKATFDTPMNVGDKNEVGSNILGAIYDTHRERNSLNSVSFADVNRLSKIVYADYGKLPADVAEIYNNTIQRYSYLYDTPLSTVRTMTKTEFLEKRNAAAFVRHTYENDTAQMVLNPKYNSSVDTIIDKVKELGNRKYCVAVAEKDMPSYYATHEFAHSILNVTQELPTGRTNYIGLDTNKLISARNEVLGIWEEYRANVAVAEQAFKNAELDIIIGATTDTTIALEAQKTLDAVRISKLSTENANEFLAEAFVSKKIGINPNQYANRVVSVLDKYFGK